MTDQLQVLIVEDEAISALALRIMLEAVGLRVCDVVDTGEAAVALAREHRPDLVLMDVQLAGELSGVAAARQLQQIGGVHCVFISAYGVEQLPELAAYPDSEVLVKPVTEEQVLALIERLRPPPGAASGAAPG